MRRAFTLIELMVCITIVSIMLGLSSAGLSSARASAKRSTCLSNLRSIGVAMNLYMDQHSALPLAGYTPDLIGGRNQLAVALEPHLDAAIPYVDSAGLVRSAAPYRCSADPGRWMQTGQSYDYRFALWLTPSEWWHDSLRVPDDRYMKRAMAELRAYPSYMTLMTDHGEWHRGNPGGAARANQARPADANALYADGHASWAGYGSAVWSRPAR